MKQGVFRIVSNEKIAKDVYRLVLAGDVSAVEKAGQFVNLKLRGFFLRRPLSVCDCTEGRLTLIYKVVGAGTEALASYTPNHKIDVLSGLGNGYDPVPAGEQPLLIGGGAGVPPLFLLCRKLLARGAAPTVILGFNTEEEIFYENEFRALGARVIVATADGSRGVRGFVTDAMEGVDYTYVYACGPEAMLRAVYDVSETGGQFSFEERMGCGFGACMGCTCRTKYGNKRICKDGPVLTKEEIIW